MGYNPNTTGTVTGGSADVNVYKDVIFGTALYRIYQKSTVTSTRIAGVSKSTAQSLCSNANNVGCTLANYKLKKGSEWDTLFACKGLKNSGSYRQIGDSNLYEVTLVSTILAVLSPNGGWYSSTSDVEETIT